ncbi:MAG TPA: TIGR03560 family F420-dependent LLM class oxidoreductase [Streptosporangiaceae bacterium]|jgi:F420-dependent oxidoreductase-like protein|nr:TIGR03560 family F420-dependent LLM class oxidoreductase [Streptosporangiaceae bacterium]
MRFSIWPSPAQSFDDIHQIAAHCERTGWDGVYFADHFMPNGPGPEPLDGDTLECWSVIAALAAVVPRVRLAPLVTSVTYRHPAVLANIAAAVDQVSQGRLTLGVGAGWQENEHAAYGIALGTVRERMDRFEEAVQILLSLLRQPRTTFAGEYFQLQDAPCQPAPVQERLPLLVGGRGERRTLRIAARYADHWNAWTTPDQLVHKISVLRAHCEDVGRDPAEIHVSTQALLFLSTDKSWLDKKRQADAGQPVIVGTPAEVTDIVAQYREAGADELIVPDFTLGPMARKQDTCDLFMQEVAPAFR